MPTQLSLERPGYLTPGSNLSVQHSQYGDVHATVLPFAPSTSSSTPVALVRFTDKSPSCRLPSETPYIVKIFALALCAAQRYIGLLQQRQVHLISIVVGYSLIPRKSHIFLSR